ncbi:MAG: hypothetical protein ABF449_08805 [Ethanoligenens sp.]
MEQNMVLEPPAPRLIHTYDDTGRGGWYAGAIEWPGAPVIVFVPGLGQPARSFWEKSEVYGLNQMYALAVADGFRAAFVGFAAEKEKPMDMWKNGRILAWQLSDICAFYQTDAVTLVAHSKGGVDAQTAAIYYGAAPRIRRLYTLSSPHWGSELADLAYSSIGFPLGERMGVHSDGCYVMQTGYMQAYRKKTDVVGRAVPLFTFAGCGSGPAFSRVWAGAQILSRWGKNDGVVTVRSAHNPNGEHVATLDFDHIQMQSGQFIWPHVRRAVLGIAPLVKPVSVAVKDLPQDAEAIEVPDGLVLRGGGMADGVQETFAVDSAARSIDICLMTAGGDAAGRFTLTAPDGGVTALHEAHSESGAQMQRTVVQNPLPGNWQLKGSQSSGAYLVSVRFGAEMPSVHTAVKTAGKRAVRKVKNMLRIFQTFPDHCQMVYEGDAAEDGELPLASGDGIYSVEQVLRGELDDGSPYERNVVRQIAMRRKRV